MSYHHWSNASGAGRRAYESQANRTNMPRFNHAGYQHQHAHYNYRNGMRQQRNFYNDEEGSTVDNHDSSNEASNGYQEAHRNGGTENGNGNNGDGGGGGGNGYRNYFTRHRVSQEGAFRGNLQLWHTRIFTRSDHNAAGSYTPSLVHNHCGCASNNIKNQNHKPLYSDIAKNTFARDDYIENGRSRGNEPFTQEVAGGYIAPNVGYMSVPRFPTPMTFIPNYSYHPTNTNFNGISMPADTNDGDKSAYDIQAAGSLNRLDDFPTLSSALRIRNNSKNRKVVKKQSNTTENTCIQQPEAMKSEQLERGAAEQLPNAESQESFNKKVLEQNPQAHFIEQLWQKTEKQEQQKQLQEQQQQQQQQQQKQLQEAALFQIYQQQQQNKQTRKDAAQCQMQQQAYLQHMQQQQQQQTSKQLQEYQQQQQQQQQQQLQQQQQQSQKSQQQDQLQQRIQAQSNANNRAFHPANLQHQENQSVFHQNPTKLFPEMRMTQQQQQLQLREFQIQQQQHQQQLSFLHYQQQAAQHQFQQLQNQQQQFMLPPVNIQPNIQRQQNGQQLGSTGASHTNEQFKNLKDPNQQLPNIQWQSIKLPMQQYHPTLLKRSDESSQKTVDDLTQNQKQSQSQNQNQSQHEINASKPQPHAVAEISILPPLNREKGGKVFVQTSAPDASKYPVSQCPAHLLNLQLKAPIEILQQPQQIEEKDAQKEPTAFASNQTSNRPEVQEVLTQKEEPVLRAQQPPIGTKLVLPDITSLQPEQLQKLSTEHFPALPKRAQLHVAQSAENVPQRYIYFPPDAIDQQQQQHLRDTFSSILISSQNQDLPNETPIMPQPPIFKMRMEDFPALPSMKARVSKKLNTSMNSDNTQTTTETLVPSPKAPEQARQRVDTKDVSSFLASLEQHCKTQQEKENIQKSGKYIPPKATLKVWPNDLITNIPPTMLTDQYGIAGLYSAHKAAEKDPHIARMTYGIDLETLGLDLRSKQPLLPKFKGPFAGECEQLYSGSNEYLLFPPKHLVDQSETNTTCNDNEEVSDNFTLDPDVRESLAPPDMEILSDEDLFYIFYTYVQDLLQLQAANELYNRAWVFYIKEKMWITHDPERSYQENGQYERGYYICYDHEESKCILKFMTIDTTQIDDRPTIPPIHRDNPNSSPNWSTS